jgi:hypothetical protein
MEIDTDTIYEMLATDEIKKLVSFVESILKTDVQSKKDWDDLITILQVACQETFQTHWLKTHHTILSVFGMPELLGVDCNLFTELRSLQAPKNIEEISDRLFEVLIEKARNQFLNGGSTLFFDVNLISSTRSAIIAAELIEARYRETIHVLNAIDETLPTLTKDWVNVSSLWRTGNGYRLLKVRNVEMLLHIKEYKEIRNLLVKELDVGPDMISEESSRLRKENKSSFLQFSSTLYDFVTGLIASRGVRGEYEPHYKIWIHHEGLDDF